ncbi:MAG: hypothetical protein EPN91_01305 [Salinibacterium sp.]|nr:MAG: hypothetical protein EPN91_01305 [Salinibacterium sp.]
MSESPDDFKRAAAPWLDNNPVKVAMSNGRYVLRGERLKKLAEPYKQEWAGLRGMPKKGLTDEGKRNWDAQASNFMMSDPKAPNHKALLPGPPKGAKPIDPYGGPASKPATSPAKDRANPARAFNFKSTVDAPPITKAAFDFNSLARHEAEFLLTSWGLPLQKTAALLDNLRSRITLDVHHLRLPPTESVKVATARHARAELAKVASALKAPIGDLVKVAAVLEDAQSVDSVLSLGFVNPENIARFASAKPMLWEVSHMLAKLLLAARLGMDDIPEESVRSALEHLQRILDGLDRLKMLEASQSKTAAAKTPPNHVGGRMGRAYQSFGVAR